MTAVPVLNTTAEEYLEFERAATERHEFFDGMVYAMAGASLSHNRISSNLSYRLRSALGDRPCDVMSSDMRTSPDEDSAYFYPDVVALCGPPLLADSHSDTLLNPSVVAEIPSDSSEGFDRGEKFARYRMLETLREYLVISQSRVAVDLFQRGDDSRWFLTSFENVDDEIPLPSLGVTLRTGDLYERVEFSGGEN